MPVTVAPAKTTSMTAITLIVGFGFAIFGVTAAIWSFFTSPAKPQSTTNRVVNVRTLTEQLKQQARALETLPDSARPAAVLEIQQLARQRQPLMAELAKTNPQRFLDLSLNLSDLQKLPAETLAESEHPTVITGKVSLDHGDDFLHRRSIDRQFMTTNDGQQVDVVVADGSALAANSTVTATGTQLGTVLVAPSGTSIQTIAPAPTIAVSGTKKIAIVLFNFQNNTAQPITAETARTTVFTNPDSTRAYYDEQSFHQLTLSGKNNTGGTPADIGRGDVYGWVTVPYNAPTTNAECENNHGAWANSADQLVGSSNLAGYDYYLYLFPQGPCPWSGKADAIGGHRAWINGSLWFKTPDIAHELGHDFGAAHASTWICHNAAGAIVPISDTPCDVVEYGDPVDPMGQEVTYHMHSFHKAQLGFYVPEDVQTITTSGTYTLFPDEVQTTNVANPKVKALRIPRSYFGSTITDYYYLDYRQTNGLFDTFPTTNPWVNGIGIRVAPGYDGTGHPYQLDMNSVDGGHGQPLPAGYTFTDSKTGISIKTNSIAVDHSSASVDITLSCARNNPTVSFLGPSVAARAGQAVTYTVQVSNNDSSSCGPSNFTIVPTLPTGWLQSPVSSSITALAPHDTAIVTFTITSPTATPNGSYTIVEQVTNTTANPQLQVNQSITLIVDNTVPVVTISNPANNSSFASGMTVAISDSATDNGTVRTMSVLIDGADVRDCTITTGTFCNYTWSTAGVAGGWHTITVQAVDYAGNLGQKSVQVYITVSGGGGGPRRAPTE